MVFVNFSLVVTMCTFPISKAASFVWLSTSSFCSADVCVCVYARVCSWMFDFKANVTGAQSELC